MQLCCVEDPLDLCSIDISGKDLKNVEIYLIEHLLKINHFKHWKTNVKCVFF